MKNSQLPPILDFNYETNKGTLFDARDGQSYPVVKIGKQIWLAENFRYLPSKEKGDPYCNSWVYDNNNDYLDLHYGRLYDWNTANNIAPEGWRLPSNEDFQELRDFIIKDNNLDYGKTSSGDETSSDNILGSYLKSIDGWNISINYQANNDKYGFSAKPAGYYNSSTFKFGNSRSYGNLWSSSSGSLWNSTDNNRAYYELLHCYFCYISSEIKDNGFSVRLIKEIVIT